MASDSMASDGTTRSSVTKIFRIKDSVVGVSGAYSSCMAVIHWLKQGSPEDDIPDFKDVYALSLRSSGIWMWDGHPHPYKLNDKFAAVGSGSQAALAALHLGLSPKDSVQVAAKIDPSTGGRVVYKSLKKA